MGNIKNEKNGSREVQHGRKADQAGVALTNMTWPCTRAIWETNP